MAPMPTSESWGRPSPGRVVTTASASTTIRPCGSVSWNHRTSLPYASRWPSSSAAGSVRTWDHSTCWRPLPEGTRRISLTLSPTVPA